MDIILLEKIANLGGLGDKVSVRPGYGRNYLIPQGKAVVATPAKIAEFEARRADLEKKAAAELAEAQARATAIEALSVSVSHKAGDEGRLYGSIGTKDIADAITAAGVKVDKHEIRLPNGAIRQTGDHEIGVHLHSDVSVVVTLQVEAE